MKSLVAWLVFALCIVYVLWGIDFHLIISNFNNYSILQFITICAIYFISFINPALRLTNLNHNILLSKAFDYQIVGVGLNNILPLKAGEGLKSVYLKKVTNLRYRDIIPLVFIERFYDVNLLIAIYILVLPLDIYYLQTVIVIVVLLWVMLFFMNRQQNIFTLIIDRIKISNKNKEFLYSLIENVSSAVHKKNILQVIIYTIIGWIVQLFLYYLVLVYFSGFDLGLSELVVLLVFSSFGLAMPSVPAGIGVYEAVMVGTLIMFGIEKESGLAAAIFLHIVQVVPTVTYTIFLLIKSKIPLSKISVQGR